MTKLRLPAVFSDHMVLQRDTALTVWGWALPGKNVSVAIAGQSGVAFSDSSGRWTTRLSALEAGGPYELVISAEDETIIVRDVLIGDVWICSGQSNMEFGLEASAGGRDAVAAADCSEIRLLHLPRVSSLVPADQIDAAWAVCAPAAARTFSAVGYFFGREVNRQVGVPIGLINASWGGTAAEAWMPVEALRSDPEFAPIVSRMEKFDPSQQPQPHADPGNKGLALGYANVDCDDSEWPSMDVPGSWESFGLDMDGAVWFRRDVEMPAHFQGPLTLDLGVIDDFDVTYFNGRQVGATGTETPNWWISHRRYQIPAELVKPGRNCIAVRVFDQWANGGLLGPEEAMEISSATAPGQKISLAGSWKYKIELALPSISPGIQANMPTSLFNGMVSPLIPFGIRGVIWYQGESNADRAFQYRKLFKALIRSWRSEWGQGEFPFLFVQLANFLERSDSKRGSAWAELREAQTMALDLAYTGQAVAIDLGDPNDIHPLNKRDVGMRLANEAGRIAYGQVTARSPMLRSSAFDGSTAQLCFDHAESGLVVKGAHPTGFTLAGENGIFYPATATIDGSTVTLKSTSVQKPVAARYGWESSPSCNVYNGDGLPVCPCRTDQFKCVTQIAQ